MTELDFTSDNASGVAPEILDALSRANGGYAASYGADEITRRLEQRFSEVFEKEVTVFPVTTGTAANALALSALTPGYGAVYCHPDSHINVDECGAPELFTGGAKLIPVGGEGARIDVAQLENEIARLPKGFEHHVQSAAISITQSSEAGTLYSDSHVKKIAEIASANSLMLHMDGARFANACATTGRSPADMTWRAGIDVLSFGATKNGAMAAEAVVFFDPALASDFKFRRKRAGHLISKMRFLSAQLDAYLEDGLWLRLARHANDAAQRLATCLVSAPGVSLRHPVQANEIFVALPNGLKRGLEAAGALFHPWPHADDDEQVTTVRMVTSWSTSEMALASMERHIYRALGENLGDIAAG